MNREFRVSRPNALWVVDFTYVHTWAAFAYVAFVIDAYARRIVGWKVSTSSTASFVLDALEQAIHSRRPSAEDGVIHHGDRGVQYLAIELHQRLSEAELVPSVGSVGDSYDNALAVEMATLRWVDWFNNRCTFAPIGYIPPAEAEANYYAALLNLDSAALLKPNSLRETQGASNRKCHAMVGGRRAAETQVGGIDQDGGE